MSPAPRPSPFVPMLLAWMVPGAGHLKLGRPWPALFIALAVVPLFVLGMVLTGWENVSFARHPYYFALQAPAGLVSVVGEYLTRGMLPDRAMPHATVGTLYSAVAGLLNLMAIADVWARTTRGDPLPHAQPDAQPDVQPNVKPHPEAHTLHAPTVGTAGAGSPNGGQSGA